MLRFVVGIVLSVLGIVSLSQSFDLASNSAVKKVLAESGGTEHAGNGK